MKYLYFKNPVGCLVNSLFLCWRPMPACVLSTKTCSTHASVRIMGLSATATHAGVRVAASFVQSWSNEQEVSPGHIKGSIWVANQP